MVEQRDRLFFAPLKPGKQDVSVAVIFAFVAQPFDDEVKLLSSVQSIEVGLPTNKFE